MVYIFLSNQCMFDPFFEKHSLIANKICSTQDYTPNLADYEINKGPSKQNGVLSYVSLLLIDGSIAFDVQRLVINYTWVDPKALI